MPIHQPYIERFGHPHDFVVEYQFLLESEGGRKTGLPHQAYLSNFWYEHDNHTIEEIFMIYPEFLDSNKELITDLDRKVPRNGVARMWILSKQMRKYHQERIKVGLAGYFIEGAKKVANCTIIELAGLMTNPIDDNE